MLDKVNKTLYNKQTGDSGWEADSTFLANSPRVMFRVFRKGGTEFILPIAALGPTGVRELHMTSRGWHALDIAMLWSDKTVTPIRDGQLAPSSRIVRGMWEDPQSPLDTVPPNIGCNVIPRALVSVDNDVELVLTNYRPAVGSLLDAGALQAALNIVPSLVTPTLGVSAAELQRYKRSVHQIGHVGGTPSILLEYHDPEPAVDTGTVLGVRPRHLIVMLDKAVYGYRASWEYHTSGMTKDRFVLHYLDAVDANGDGVPELFFSIDFKDGRSYTVMYRFWNDTWRESWRHSPGRCDY